MNPVEPQTVMQLLRELSTHVTQPTQLVIGGSVALLLSGLLARHTDDIDVVDELPASVRDQPQLLDELARRYGLRLAEFESRYLPEGWTQRIRSIDALDKLLVFAIDPYDVFIGKVFSTREKDRDDLRAVAPLLEWHLVLDRLRRTTTTLRADARLYEAAKQNWFILSGENLPA